MEQDQAADRANDHPKGPGDSLLRAIVQGSNDAVFAKDFQGRYVWLNPRHARFLGRSAEEVTGRSDTELFAPEFAKQLALLDAQVLDAHVPMTYEVVSKTGNEEQIFLTTKGVYYDDHGNVAGLIGISRDITEERRRQEALQDFFAMVAHDIRSPLSAIKAAVDLATEDAKEGNIAEVTSYLSEIDGLSNRLLDLARDLLDLSQIESAAFSLERQPADLEPILAEALREVPAGAVSVEVHLPNGLPLILVDPGRVTQILTNLLSNAFKFAEPGSAVRIDAEQAGREVVVRVRNHGEAIPGGKVPFLFEKFVRLHGKETKGAPADTGLGLSICKGLVTAHGGSIWMERHEEQLETVFAFTLPLAE